MAECSRCFGTGTVLVIEDCGCSTEVPCSRCVGAVRAPEPPVGEVVLGEYRGRVFAFRRATVRWQKRTNNSWYESPPPERWAPMPEWRELPNEEVMAAPTERALVVLERT